MKGTHGTSKSRAIRIQKEGFSTSDSGKRGRGAYFWAYNTDSMRSYVRDLGIHWWKYGERKGTYSGDKDGGCCIIFVKLQTPDEQIIDFENQKVREIFIKYASTIDTLEEATAEEKISKVYDMFVCDYEEKTGVQINLISVKIPPPNKFKPAQLGHPSLDITGQPLCYVVRNTNCINIDDMEEVGNE